MSAQPKGGGGHIAFGADPVGVRVAHCLRSISWTSGCILTKLAQTHYWEGGNKWLDFRDLYLIFKFTAALRNFQILTKKKFVCTSLLNQMTDSGQTSYIVTLRWFKDLIRFWRPWPNFQGHHTIKTVKMSLVCTHHLNQLVDYDQTCIETPLGHGAEMVRFFFTLTSFSRSHQHFKCQIITKKSLSALNQMMDSGQTLCIVSLG